MTTPEQDLTSHGFTSGPEPDLLFSPSEHDTLPRNPSTVGKMIGDKGFITREDDRLAGEEKELGVVRDAGRHDRDTLTFDSATLDRNEAATIRDFLGVHAQGIEAVRGSKFGWFFANENDQFIHTLAEALTIKLDQLQETAEPGVSLYNRGFNQRILDAAASFREMAKRRQIKEGLNKQVRQIPIIGFEGIPRNPYFNPDDWTDPRNEIEFMFVNSPSGKGELIISCKSDGIEKIRPIFTNESSNANGSDYLEIQLPSGWSTEDDGKGGELVKFEIAVLPQNDPNKPQPLFSKITILQKPINMDKELDLFIEEQERQQEQQQQKPNPFAPSPAPSVYTPPLPAAPSTPNYSQTSTWVRSG